ncbi:hypothetical protein WICPIJ_002386 [Wickerhamomyces pijperi]|uniref:Ubiquitin-like modifier-activating enzyme ATG7 n=1 Tax=Wickerhamomyces pijperi TaxID=599730 RepID=A0A9P8Q9X5_WICPI|nr:hypothetical protein WICPIJ_002386 [Wickerhamomyces pijperi]
MTEPILLKFAPVNSFVDSSFFQELSKRKLDQFKLDSTKKPLFATFDIQVFQSDSNPTISLSSESFGTFNTSHPGNNNNERSIPGFITNLNTIEEFKKLDKSAFIKDAADVIMGTIDDKSFLEDLSVLNCFQVISFADLKKFKFYYWISTPSVHSVWEILEQSSVPDISEDILLWIQQQGSTGNNIFKLTDGTPSKLTAEDLNSGNVLSLGYLDTSTQPNKPSKLLQNQLAAIQAHGINAINISIFRSLPSQSYQLRLSSKELDRTKVNGWERTSQGKLGPKLADLSSLIDPVKLSEQSVDLNLKLMKWRVAPNINLDIVKDTRILLLGSGTLGCYVARGLLGWGVRHITFVDNGKVAFSNPVRQPLFNFEDVGSPKAEKAAESLKKIFPMVESRGVELEIPMAGHPVTNPEKQKKEFETLVRLISDHDVVFLLTDSRETRWLPTVIANDLKKIVINAALGFDSYLVMRHGVEGNLGCYFCNDVVAPTDSLTDRTLDQMCTVARPGVALLAASLAVELLVSILQHPDKHYAGTDQVTILGKLTHQLRGFLGGFDVMKLEAPAFEHCSACSKKVLTKYNEKGWDFIVKCLNDPKYVEEVSGLAEVQRQADEALMDLSENLGSDDDW